MNISLNQATLSQLQTLRDQQRYPEAYNLLAQAADQFLLNEAANASEQANAAFVSQWLSTAAQINSNDGGRWSEFVHTRRSRQAPNAAFPSRTAIFSKHQMNWPTLLSRELLKAKVFQIGRRSSISMS